MQESDSSRDLIRKAPLADDLLPDAANDFGAGGSFGVGLDGDFGGGFMELPQISDLTGDDSKEKGLE